MGRLARAPHPALFRLLYEPQLAADKGPLVPLLLAVDAAHVVMLAERGLLPPAVAAQLLAVNRDLEARVAAGEDPIGEPASHRGLYALYEHLYVERLGAEAGGAAHFARSRNDVNAALTRLRLGAVLFGISEQAAALLELLLALAERHAGTLMAGFTHFEPAQPTSFGHYLAAVAAELLRTAEWLAESAARADRSPLGAAAGFGTSQPIDRERVAELLGFSGVIESSLDAVASRDYAVHAGGALAMLGMTLTRLASDLQTWGSAAYRFLAWPDELVSTSSIMPQKRNVFALENLRGRAVRPVGALVNLLLGLKNTPFTNSVEVSGEATSHLWPAAEAATLSLELARLLLEAMEVDASRMTAFLSGRQTTMTAVANLLVEDHGLPFRTAHGAAGRLAAEQPDAEERPEEVARRLPEIVAELAGRRIEIDPARLRRALDPAALLAGAVYGGGPAPESVRNQLAALGGRLAALCRDLEERKKRKEEAAWRLTAAVSRILRASDETAARETHRDADPVRLTPRPDP